MSRYPSYEVARFDQQFAETERERNARLAKARKMRARVCSECGENAADVPSDLCPGCQAYRDHTGQF